MKKVLAVFMAMLLPVCAGAALAEELPEVTFRGARLGATLGEVRETLGCSVSKGSAWSYYAVEDIQNPDIGFLNNCFEENKDAGSVILADEYMSVDDVAGYKPSMTAVCFVRPVADGALVTEDDSAIFYAGVYTFVESKDKTKPLFEDLAGKLTALYGQPNKDGSRLYWLCRDNTEIDLILNGSQVVRLSYVWTEAQSLMEDACNAAAARGSQDNSSITNGL